MFMFSSESKNTPRSPTTADRDIMSDPTSMSWSADVIFLRFVAKPNHITSVFFELKALRRAQVVHRRHTSSKPSGDVTDVGRLTLLDALHVVSKRMVTDMMLLKNVGDFLGLCDKGTWSQRGTLWCANSQFADKR